MVREFLTGLAVGGIGAMLTMHYHIVRTNERILVVSRIHQAPLRSAYVDVRDWGPVSWQQYPELSEALVKAGHSELMARDNRRRTQDQAVPASNVSSGNLRSDLMQHPVLGPAQTQPEPNQNYPASPYSGGHSPTAMLDRELSDAPLAVTPISQVRSIPSGVAPVPVSQSPATQIDASSSPESPIKPQSPAIERPNWVKSLLQSFTPSAHPNATTQQSLPITIPTDNPWNIDATSLKEIAGMVMLAQKSMQPVDAPTTLSVAIEQAIPEAVIAQTAEPVPAKIQPTPAAPPVMVSDSSSRPFPSSPIRISK